MGERPSGTIAFLFTDVEGSTRLWDEHDDDMDGALAVHDRILQDAIAAEAGYVFSTQGDAFAAAFDSAPAAARAAASIQRALASHEWPDAAGIKVRIGLHVGEAHERDGDYFGPTLNRTARLVDENAPIDVPISSGRLVEGSARVPSGSRALEGRFVSGVVRYGKPCFRRAGVNGAPDRGDIVTRHRPPRHPHDEELCADAKAVFVGDSTRLALQRLVAWRFRRVSCGPAVLRLRRSGGPSVSALNSSLGSRANARSVREAAGVIELPIDRPRTRRPTLARWKRKRAPRVSRAQSVASSGTNPMSQRSASD